MQQQKSFAPLENRGTLYLVGTPIGNLEDMTVRAVHTLQAVDVIAAEDTRHTRKLTNYFDIHVPLVSYHEHNQQKQGDVLLKRLLQGEAVALVSDAGLPAISDPGSALVATAIAHDIPVVPIPGANAALSALIASGLPTDHFLFLGFLPRERKACRRELQQWRDIRATLLLYEAPHRLLSTLALIADEWGNRQAAVARELTKRHEEWLRGTIDELVAWFEQHPPRGECSLAIEGNTSEVAAEEELPWWHALSLEAHVAHWIAEGASSRDAIQKVAVERNMKKRDVYNYYHRRHE